MLVLLLIMGNAVAVNVIHGNQLAKNEKHHGGKARLRLRRIEENIYQR